MIAFRFRLQKVLDWRRVRLEMEEARLTTHAAALAEIDRVRAELDAAAIAADIEVREWNPLAGADLAALDGFHLHVRDQQGKLAAHRAARQREFDAQLLMVIEARRHLKLLEQLRQRRWEEWQAAENKEIEALAGETFLARVVRERGHLPQ